MARTQLQVLALTTVVVATLALPSVATAGGGRYTFVGGTPRERTTVVRALQASRFEWQLLPTITIRIARGVLSQATPGEIWLDAALIDAGSFAWGVVQHEYAHQVDFFLLTAPARALLLRRLGGSTWCDARPAQRGQLGCERFASTLAWAYWPSTANCMGPPQGRAFDPASFRRLMSRLLAGSEVPR